MKTTNYISLFIILLILNACKKDPSSKPANFTSTTYQNLAPYDPSGKPTNLLKDTVPPAMLSFIDSILPDGVNLTIRHPELFTSTAGADIAITKPSDVFITFVSGVAGNANSIAFYTYPTNNPPTKTSDIKLITYIFPDAGYHTTLQAGDKAEIGKFDAGTTIGFVLMQNAWNAEKGTLNNDAVHFCTTDALNPEVDPNLKRHAVLIDYAPTNKLLIGFEDMERTNPQCDNDFNDAVLYCTINSY